jgi:hypothetical protein
MSIFKRIRSILKTGLLWAVSWIPASLVLAASQLLTGYHEAWTLLYLFKLAVAYGVLGFITGTTFGAVISLTEARKSFAQLKGWRVSLWGGLAALAWPAAWWLLGPPNPWRLAHVGLFLINAGVLAVTGVGCAATMLGVARRAERLPPPLERPALPGGPREAPASRLQPNQRLQRRAVQDE